MQGDPGTQNKRTNRREAAPNRTVVRAGASQEQVAAADTRFDRRMAEILQHATDVFYEKGYEGSSMRDLSRASGMSLAGLYYYFESKEKLLYLVQKHTFETVIDRLNARLAGVDDPEKRLRVFVHNHLEYFLANQRSMTVLSHEDRSLANNMGEEIRELKRRYYHVCRELVSELAHARGVEINERVASLSLFGMLNWIYTWYKPEVDEDADRLAREMGDIFMHGLLAGATGEQSHDEEQRLQSERAPARNKRSGKSSR